jgi:hypothetical protein
MGRLTPEQLAAFVAESCDRQGVPVKVTDLRVLANVATLLRGDSRASKLEDRTTAVGEAETGEALGELRETGS